jgi:UrcA family protein
VSRSWTWISGCLLFFALFLLEQATGLGSMAASAFRISSRMAAFALGTFVLMGSAAQAADPNKIDEITISSARTKVLGHDSATGAPITQVMKTAKIQYDPVTLTTNSGVSLLKDSVEKAARDLCNSIDPLDPDDGACVRNAIDSTIPQVEAAVARTKATH